MELMEKIKNAPTQPGCYIFRDIDGCIIYVGKSKCLKNRVKNYFRKIDPENEKLFVLNRRIHDVEYIITDTEIDALILEYTLIKRHKPWYNLQHKSDKKYYSIQIDAKSPVPTLSVTAEEELKKGLEYFGFFYNIDDAKEALDVLNSLWHTPTCNKEVFKDNERPCLNLHMGKCRGICINRQEDIIEIYRENINEIIHFLKGKKSDKILKLKAEMFNNAEAMEFEKAEVCREILTKAEYLQKRSRNLFKIPHNKNILVFIRAYKEQGFYIYYISKGEFYVKSGYTDNPRGRDLDEFYNGIMNKSFKQDKEVLRAVAGIYGDKKFIKLPRSLDLEKFNKIVKKELINYI